MTKTNEQQAIELSEPTPGPSTTPRDQLQNEMEVTLASERMRPGLAAGALFKTMDLLYGSKATLGKFRVLEVVARVPYIAWEQVGYVAVTHTHSDPGLARKIHTEVTGFRAQQDNELYHLLMLEELLQHRGERQGFWRFRVIPQILAWVYYHLSWLLYAIGPKWSHKLNAEFEDHAEHEYMAYVAAHPELGTEQWVSQFKEDYGDYETLADLLRRIGMDEREHKLESLEQIDAARFGADERR